MKRLLSVLLIVALLASLCVFASADTQTMLATVKERIGDTSSYQEFNSGTWERNGRTYYEFSWETDGEEYRCLSVTITSTGILTNYSCYQEWENAEITLKRPAPAAVLETAKAFVKQLNPTICEELEVTVSGRNNLLNAGYYFNIQRMKNGIPVAGDVGSMQIAADGKTLEYCNFSYTEGLVFDSAAQMIDAKAAQKAFAEKIGLTLSYKTKMEKKVRTAYLAYEPTEQFGSYISALTGEVVKPTSPTGGYGDFENALMDKNEATASEAAGFTPAEQAELDQQEGLLSAEAEEKLLRENALLHLDAAMKIANRRRSKLYGTEIYTDSINFRGEKSRAYVTVNAATGAVLDYYFYDETEGTKLTEEQANTAAKAAARVLAGDVFAEYRERSDDGRAEYVRYVNDVPFYEDNIYASYSQATGLLESYSISHSELDFPSPAGTLTPAQAAEKLFEQVEYVPTYVMDCTGEKPTAYNKATLVYSFREQYNLTQDPFTGKLLRNNQEQSELPVYTDIAGHYGETAINALREYGIGFDTAEYQPSKVITQGEYITLLNAVFYGYHDAILKADADYGAVCRAAVSNGILKESEADAAAPLTREMAAVLLIRALGLDAVASLDGIYNCKFPDVTTHIGHVSILGAMGVFRGDSKGNFRPNDHLTRADAAIVLYNYLTK